MKLRLQIIDAPATPVYEFTGSTVTIGRDNACELSLKGTVNQNVSGKHAQIVLTAEGVFLVDLKSTNGTFLNDHRVDGRKLLRQGDQFRLGHTGPRLQVLEVVLANAAESGGSGHGHGQPARPRRRQRSKTQTVCPGHDRWRRNR